MVAGREPQRGEETAMSKIDYGTCETSLGTINLTEQASHACHPDKPGLWTARGTDANGDKVQVYWDFSADECAAAGECASSLPWDDEHIVEVRRI